jgi:hypothetical protein
MSEGETFTEFIARRRRELDNAEEQLRRRLAAVSAEREQLGVVERLMIGERTPQSEIRRAISKRKKGIKPGTIMDRVVKILELNPDGLMANDILRHLNDQPGEDFIARESLSPQLSRLKQAGYLMYRNSIWKLLPDELGAQNEATGIEDSD